MRKEGAACFGIVVVAVVVMLVMGWYPIAAGLALLGVGGLFEELISEVKGAERRLRADIWECTPPSSTLRQP